MSHDELEQLLTILAPDPRLTLCEVDVQDGALVGVVEASVKTALEARAASYPFESLLVVPEPQPARVAVGHTALYASPDMTAAWVSEACYGEAVVCFDTRGDMVRVRTVRDGYLGWLHRSALGTTLLEATHRFIAPRGHAFLEPKVSAIRDLELAHGAALHIESETDGWCCVRLGDSAVFVKATLLEPLTTPLPEPTSEAVVALAKRFLETPYVWGGTTAWGLDCSGLVQTVYAAFGVALPRDADQQAQVGLEVVFAEAQPGDLYFLPGHVMLATGEGAFIHASGRHMRVSIDHFESEYGRLLEGRVTKTVRLL